MTYLLSQLWLYLFGATLLGCLIGWFLRGDNRSQLTEIENRWRHRFSKLEYTNQNLLKRLRQTGMTDRKYTTVKKRLDRMTNAADLASQQLKLKDTIIAKANHENDLNSAKLLANESQIDELISKLTDAETIHDSHQEQRQSIDEEEFIDTETQPTVSEKSKTNLDNTTRTTNPARPTTADETDKANEKKSLSKRLEEKTADYVAMQDRYQQLAKKADKYKVSLLDAESKLEITLKTLEEQTKSKPSKPEK